MSIRSFSRCVQRRVPSQIDLRGIQVLLGRCGPVMSGDAAIRSNGMVDAEFR